MDRPAWVVLLSTDARKNKPARRDIKYVRSATQAGAIRCAKAHSYLPLRCFVSARLATPKDLGCVPTQQPQEVANV